ncbi:hypothetical protein HanXRQr2_Chr07g0290561 [Helianthus annuus]|uniref:Uncharacterized protein n=1 Tax=Helianthus annuus TaxID=4232 RepID=A0A9K3IJZ4_HELAN|nr:hypothetical protein HanXRQr2_Chr07g0290561 [Helianthus annuus]KAJ0904366.1 hypothetical protein HanPSC8_Chr07g0281301 [Helianthus annuus]
MKFNVYVDTIFDTRVFWYCASTKLGEFALDGYDWKLEKKLNCHC